MARIRTIKPEFPQSQSMGRVSRDARLLFVLLWTIADDSGRTRAASRMLASLLFPYDDDAASLIEGWLDELEQVGSIVRYQVDGDDYLEVCKWRDHQKIDRPSKSKIPPLANPREPSTSPRECSSGDRDLDLDRDQRTKDLDPMDGCMDGGGTPYQVQNGGTVQSPVPGRLSGSAPVAVGDLAGLVIASVANGNRPPIDDRHGGPLAARSDRDRAAAGKRRALA